jgi:hypothetical protein
MPRILAIKTPEKSQKKLFGMGLNQRKIGDEIHQK